MLSKTNIFNSNNNKVAEACAVVSNNSINFFFLHLSKPVAFSLKQV